MAVHSFNLDPELDILQTVRRFEQDRFLLLLDSAARHRERDSRYSFLTADPVRVVRLDEVTYGDNPFQTLRDWQQMLGAQQASVPSSVPWNSGEATSGLPPFFGGIAGLMSYELGGAFERLPSPSQNDFQTPALLAGLFDWAIVWDHLNKTVRLFVIELPIDGQNAVDRIQWVRKRLENDAATTGTDFAQRSSSRHSPSSETRFAAKHQIEPSTEVYSDFPRDEYVRTVARVIEYIRAGDIFQANLSQRLMAPWSRSAVDLYGQVRRLNPAPFCGLLTFDDVAIVSASPERFIKVNASGLVETRPIKGTRRRPRSPIAELFAVEELTSSEKDRAENVMIVDLLRNDVSRSCLAGSVKVTGLCELEKFETVLHLVSTVQGQLNRDRDVWDLMAGCFPGGSITGAPKIRAMEIIAELEPIVRGAYCGSLFALGPHGDFDSSILIRTFTLKDGWVQFPVGGGIVADSDPLDEYRETLHKASGMIRALRQS
ncbi:MAG: anthranilate synthase component I family protein [Planctomycetaceae bacterium]